MPARPILANCTTKSSSITAPADRPEPLGPVDPPCDSERKTVCVFARYPEAGKCKTRLIPAVGAEGACRLHQDMTQHTLEWARELSERDQTQIEVRYYGGSEMEFAEKFEVVTKSAASVESAANGNSAANGKSAVFRLCPQADGDLGTKLFCALQSIAGNNATARSNKVIFVGTDCPELDSEFVESAFRRLDDHDVCFAPATDGGYVLLGVRVSKEHRVCEFESLFRNIDWGTEFVLQQSLAAIRQQRLKVSLLPTLRDVDLPEDLPIWHDAIQRARSDESRKSASTTTSQLAVVIPTKDSEPGLQRTLEAIQIEPGVEVVVAATGDCTETRAVCAERKVQLVECHTSRGHQWNAAVEASSADSLLLLHADTRLPASFPKLIESCLRQTGVVAGAFQLQIDSQRLAARWVERGVKYRSEKRQFPYGDQAIFLKRDTLERVGGVPCQPIMEDYELVRKLRRLGRIAIADQRVTTSARRWHRLGFLKTTLINQLMIAGYYLGVPVSKLARLYRGRT